MHHTTTYLVRGWDGADFPPGHTPWGMRPDQRAPPSGPDDPSFPLMRGRKYEKAVKLQKQQREKQQQQRMLGLPGDEPLVILNNDHAVFDLIRRRTLAEGKQQSGNTGGPRARTGTPEAPPCSVTRTVLLNAEKLFDALNDNGEGLADVLGVTDDAPPSASPRLMLVTHGLHPGYGKARCKMFNLSYQAIADHWARRENEGEAIRTQRLESGRAQVAKVLGDCSRWLLDTYGVVSWQLELQVKAFSH